MSFKRTHHCTELNATNVGETVTLCGWVNASRNLGGMVFIDLRDREGITQIFVDPAKYPELMEKQNYYQQMVEDVTKDRDYYKQDRDETREKLDKLSRSVMDWKRETDQTIDDLRRQVARNGRQMEAMRPFMCADLKCKKRQLVARLEDVAVKGDGDTKQQDIEPLNSDEL